MYHIALLTLAESTLRHYDINPNEKKILAVKTVREVVGLGMAESKALVSAVSDRFPEFEGEQELFQTADLMLGELCQTLEKLSKIRRTNGAQEASAKAAELRLLVEDQATGYAS